MRIKTKLPAQGVVVKDLLEVRDYYERNQFASKNLNIS